MLDIKLVRGKPISLTTAYLWCIANGKKVKACAPTGMPDAHADIDGRGAAATTIHALFDVDCEL